MTSYKCQRAFLVHFKCILQEFSIALILPDFSDFIYVINSVYIVFLYHVCVTKSAFL